MNPTHIERIAVFCSGIGFMALTVGAYYYILQVLHIGEVVEACALIAAIAVFQLRRKDQTDRKKVTE